MTNIGQFRFKTAEIGIFNTAAVRPVTDSIRADNRVIGLTNGEFSLIDLIAGCLQKTGPAHVVVATWSAGIKDAHQCRWLLDSDRIQTFRLITDHSYATRQKKYALSITDLFGTENIRTCESHSKFVLIHNDEWHLSIRTSMNLNANRTCENFEIENTGEVFDLFWNWCQHHFDDMPAGFCGSTWRASKALGKFFQRGGTYTEQPYKNWSDL